MNKSTAKTMLLVMIAMVSLMMAAQIAGAGVKNSKHDLSSGSTGAIYKATDTDQVCVFCHTPHFASNSAAPLWNRSVTSSSTYNMYTSTVSATFDMTVAASPQGVSAACLSCHDGTVAFDALLNKPGSGIGVPSEWTWDIDGEIMTAGTSPAAMLGFDMRNDHPISVTYDTSKDNAFTAPASGKVGTLPLYGTAKDQMECASCHNVHEPGAVGSTAPFLRLSNAGSALCLTCHIK